MTIESLIKTTKELSKDVRGVGIDNSFHTPSPTEYILPITSDKPFRGGILASEKNMSKSNLLSDKDCQEAFDRGFDLVADRVKTTLGAGGSNGLVESDLSPGYEITNDGATLAEQVHSEDPFEELGVKVAKRITKQADLESRDGTTTAITLAQAIRKEGRKTGIHSMLIKNSLDECLPIIYKAIDDQTKPITIDSISQVVSTSAESKEMGDLFQEIYQKIGPNGIIELDNSNTPDTYYQIREGVRLRNCGYMAPYMANEGKKSVLRDPKIIISRQKINTLADIDPIFQKLTDTGVREVVIFCDEIDVGVFSALAFTHKAGVFKTLIIKAPRLWKDWLFEDFAKITGATIISPESGITFNTFDIDKHLGTCQKLITTNEDTTVLGIKDISEHLKSLEEEPDENTKLRIAWLNTQVAVLKLGANSEGDLSYKRKKAEDAIGTAFLALKGGIVPGGGVCLLNSRKSLPNTIGGKILATALASPIQQIITNSGYVSGLNYEKFILQDSACPFDPVKKDYQGDILGEEYGFNAKVGTVCHMREAGIVDAALVIKNAVKSAISEAGTALTINSLSYIPKEPKENKSPFQ